MAVQHWYLHADLDAFFASVEQLDHPEYRGKPVIVGGLPGDLRSVVSTASYEARKFGVHSAMPTKEAYRLCPHGIYVRGNHQRYEEVSFQIMQIFARYSPDIQQMSIDEAFIDLTGTERLFGPPEETAMKIKQAVKEETGLTCSIGLASSKYFAKLSSDINKPDGFYFMKPGTETAYMTSIPIEKIWGIGKKTAARIKDSGLKTTKQIFETPLETLTFMYGENTANFLYNILRGNDGNTFDGEAKSHSVSNERTFPFDIYDRYTNETILMELAHSVMFRMLKANLKSRTVVVKIRYDDFSTVSQRQTYPQDIITLDSFFEKVKDLFEQKYDVTRGVRLLGVGFDNVHKEESTYQQSLFDDGDKKKQAVEQAILKIEQKFPDINVRKARVIKPPKKELLVFLALLSGFSFFHTKGNNTHSSTSLYAKEYKASSSGAGAISVFEEAPLPVPKESPEHLLNLTLKDSEVDFYASGFWKAGFTGSTTMSFGSPFGLSFSVPVFRQEVDFLAGVTINDSWFFETEFADEFNKNTITLGYRGDGTIKKAVLSNRNITYPSVYSSSVFGFNPEGGKNQAPGFMMHLEKDSWFSDFLLRYDMQKSFDASFYGMNSVNDTKTSPSSYISGRFYTLPGKWVSKIRNVYVEDSKGNYKDKHNRKFLKLTESDFFISENRKSLILSKSHVKNELPVILITFMDASDLSGVISASGSFDDESSFFGKIQKLFDSSSYGKVPLNKIYGNSEDYIDGSPALILQGTSRFSPYQNASFYDLGFSETEELMVWSLSSETEDTSYVAENVSAELIFSGSDFFNDERSYGRVYPKTENAALPDYENNPLLRFPFAEINPYIYLENNAKTNLSVLSRSYSPVTNIQITKDASAGSVRVYKNGTLDTKARFDPQTGYITLSSPVTEHDKIYVTWNEETEDISQGAVTAAAGFGYNITPELTADTDFTLFWPVTELSGAADADSKKAGWLSLNSGINFQKENLKLQDNISLSLSNSNVTGNLVILEPSSDIPETFYLSSDAGYKTIEVPVISGTDLSTSYRTDSGSLSGKTDPGISGFMIPLSADFTSVPENETAWTASDIKLSSFTSCRECAFSFKLQPPKNKTLSEISNILEQNTELYLQLGVSANEDGVTASENALPTFCISKAGSKGVKNPLRFEKEGWQIISLELTNEERAMLSRFHDARLIVIEKNHKTETPVFTINAGPYEIFPSAIETKAGNGIEIKSRSTKDNSVPSRNRFHKTFSSSETIEWKTVSPSLSYNVSAADYFKAQDFSSYRNISFYFKLKDLLLAENTSEAFVLTLDRNSESFFENDQTAIRAVLSSDALSSLGDDMWHSFTISLSEKAVYIDGTRLSSELYSVQINQNIVPDKVRFDFNGYEKGSFTFDSVFYEGNSPYLKAQNYVHAEIKKEGTVFGNDAFPILKDVSFRSASNQTASLNTATNAGDGILTGNAEASLNLLGLELSMDSDFSSESFIPGNAGHSIKTDSRYSGIFSYMENYRFSSIENSSEKSDYVMLTSSKAGIPLTLKAGTKGKTGRTSNTQNYDFSLLFNSRFFKADFSGVLDQKINTVQTPEEKVSNREYFDSYSKVSKLQFSEGSSLASKRNEEIKSEITVPFNNIEPKFSFGVSEEYSSVLETTSRDTTKMTFSLPFRISKQAFEFEMGKKGSGISTEAMGGNYGSDLNTLSKSLSEKTWFFKTVPFWDFFETDTGKAMKESFNPTENTSLTYISDLAFKWRRPLSNSLYDFFLPSNLSLQAERNITRTDSFSDTYQFKLVSGSQAVNIFGKDSRTGFFSWYKSDEYITSSEFIVKTPRESPSDTVFSVNLYGQALFFIDAGSSLKGAADFTMDTEKLWSARQTLIFSYPGSQKPYRNLLSLIIRNKDPEVSAKRKDSLNISFGENDTEGFLKCALSHVVEIDFLKNYQAYASALAEYSWRQKSTDTLSVELSLGAKMMF